MHPGWRFGTSVQAFNFFIEEEVFTDMIQKSTIYQWKINFQHGTPAHILQYIVIDHNHNISSNSNK